MTALTLHWHLRKCAGTAVRSVFNMPTPLPGYAEAHDHFENFVALETRSACPSCSVLRVVVLREPYAQLLSEVSYFPRDFYRAQRASTTSKRNSSRDSGGALIYDDDHMVCNRHALMGLCAPTSSLMPKPRVFRWRQQSWKLPPRCSVDFTLRVLRGFDVVGFTDEMDYVWSAMRTWAEQHVPVANGLRAAYMRRLGRQQQRSAYHTFDNATSSSTTTRRGVADYLRVARALLAKAEQATSGFVQEATERRANASRAQAAGRGASPAEQLRSDQAFRARVHKHLDGANEAQQRVALLERFPSRAEFERRNGCALRVWSEARRLFGHGDGSGRTRRAQML